MDLNLYFFTQNCVEHFSLKRLGSNQQGEMQLKQQPKLEYISI
jgi:hypothetical protein